MAMGLREKACQYWHGAIFPLRGKMHPPFFGTLVLEPLLWLKSFPVCQRRCLECAGGAQIFPVRGREAPAVVKRVKIFSAGARGREGCV